ncbi:NAD(P)H-binding protein [Sneathiella marina]|uniref:NAD(P)H-binding protein n=1 Tax=Sneathiella marina TaxID=2950108 RepID=A0ABY4W952_9PROT|nr:NAD(P)H-binding protein [Sneathiella marina]USG62462.1 NAD(P)H-binding protein [Sneathiella marina]
MAKAENILITGATGMVGHQVLKLLLQKDGVKKVVSISRNPTGLNDPRLTEIFHDNFMDFRSVANDLKEIDICFYCLGVYQGGVQKDKFFEITCDYQRALTDVLADESPEATFVLFGAQGADPTEKNLATFAKAKGRAENLLSETAFPRKFIFRPGYIFPTGIRQPKNLLYKIFGGIVGLLRRFDLSSAHSDQDLAKAMVIAAFNDERAFNIFEEPDIKRIARS